MKRSLAFGAALVFVLAWFPAAPSAQRRPSVSNDLLAHAAGGHRHRVIVQADDAALTFLRVRHLGLFRRQMAGALVLDVTDAELAAMENDSSVAHISGDLPVHGASEVTDRVTNAVTVWQGSGGLLGLLGGTPGYTGSGVVVAVLDSGIASHVALGAHVIAHVDLVSDEPGVTGDPFGHGTHVAGIAGGNGNYAGRVGSPYIGGSAPSVSLVDVRVLGSDGAGLTSDVIGGIDWVIANRAKYRIRVINLSLGHPVTEPSASDPLDQAVERAVDAGIVVVAAAGNDGETSTGVPVLGGITSPGNSPYAITVGATDTNGTVSTADDTLAPYSSRGPTRFDFAVKPDVVAPGTRIVSLEAYRSYLSAAYPSWHIAGSGTNGYLRMSGTSMATAVVSGGIALMLNAHPGLTPSQVKVALQMSARFLPDAGLIGGGTGAVDFAEANKIAGQGLLGSLLTTVTNLLGLSSGASFRDNGTMIDGVYDGSGVRLLGLLDLSSLLNSSDAGGWGILNLLGGGNPLSTGAPNRVVWGQVAGWSNSYFVVWGSSMQDPSGEFVVWGSGDETDSTFVVWGSGFVPRQP
ncbi:MAG TPA: S8 family peptidase [Vicinamibacterales bacterium]|nr:S8 family peptidase [Vicinamibacterales bacterium]